MAALALALLAPGAPVAAQAPEPRASLPDIEDEVMCPVCGTTLELAAEAPQANRQREFIRDLIAQGYTKEQIKDALVAEFGEDVLATPDTEGFDLVAWLVPALALLVAAAAIVVGLRRWRRRSEGEADEPERRDPPPDDAESRKLEQDLARYEL